MSFLFGGRPQLSSAEKIAAAETEVEMVSDMFNRLNQSCTKKCIPPEYREADLNKGESVCLDRCVSKFFEVNMKVSEKMQGEAASRQGPTGAMNFGM
ncbi:protein transporter tim10 [Loxospora ochrophaea]|nr:protein transporter tim10 [Loxospora ochrophaea]